MCSVEEPDDLVEDNFDDQSFEDAPLSDVESNFDEEDLQSVDGAAPVSPQNAAQTPRPEELCVPTRKCSHRSGPTLSVISEESRIEITDKTRPSSSDAFSEQKSPLSEHKSPPSDDLSLTPAFSIKSSDFVSDQKASDLLQREQESFMRGYGRFIPDDPRFNRSHFEKENSWEPSVIEHSFDPDNEKFADDEIQASVENVNATPFKSTSRGRARDKKGKQNSKELAALAAPEIDMKETNALDSLTNIRNLGNTFSLNAVRTTPKRVLAKQSSALLANSSPSMGDGTAGVVQTSTPVSTVAKLAARTRRLELAENFHGISMIVPEKEKSVSEGESLVKTDHSNVEDTTMFSQGRVQSIIKNHSSSTVLKALDEYARRDRVKAKSVRVADLPPRLPKERNRGYSPIVEGQVATFSEIRGSRKNAAARESTTSVESSAQKSAAGTSRAAAVTQYAAPESTSSVTSVEKHWAHGSSEGLANEDVISQPLSRPSSVRSTGSLSTTVGPRSASQMSSVVTKRSMLHIPKLEVAFGFVAIGDTAVSTVDVTNKTDHAVRIRAKLNPTAPSFTMPVRGLGGSAVVTVKARDDLRLSRNGSYILQSSYESTFSFTLINSGNRKCLSASDLLYQRLTCHHRPRSFPQHQQRYEKKMGVSHTCEGLQFTDFFVGEDPEFCPPQDHPVSKEDMRLFDQTLRMCTIYVCSPRIRPRPSLISNESLERSLQPEDTFREKSTYRAVVSDQTLC
ncbi:unnamed protein product [Nippostrongylus brasiliensis]|uniref:ASH domain-containing protein n=1 Tax=Nippostrongylus brasiliensis TaxID=27835 RepID=A0A0N4XWB1_NIPBR|nr:unnamed protein product [Nippostrongylus brasiliensis]